MELEGGGHDYHEFWIPKRNQKKLQNTSSWELQKGGLSNHRLLDLIKNKKRSENETIDKELKGKAWRPSETNVLYSIHCTVQYHDGAIKQDRVDFSAVVIKVNTGDHDSKDRFVDTDIERSLMIDVLKIEIHGNNCMRTNFTPDQKYCSNMQNGSQITTREDKADFSTVVIRVNIDGSESEDKFVDSDIKKSLIVDGLGTKAYETDCMGTHLTPTCTGPEIYYSNMPNGSQDIATVEGDSISLGSTSTERWTPTETGQFLCCSGSREKRRNDPSIRPIQSPHPRCILSSRKSRQGMLQVWPALGQ